MLLNLIRTLLLLTVTGCMGGEDQNSDRERTPTVSKADIAAIQKNLAAFRKHRKWSGNRWRVTGIRDGYPVTESIGAWQIEAVPAKRGPVIELRGIRLGELRSVQLDLARGLLLIDGEPFVGRPIAGKSPIVRDAPFKGAVFERQDGSITGKAALLFLEDGRALLDFYKVWAKGQRGAYGALSPEKAAD
jgi:hypothetical protein